MLRFCKGRLLFSFKSFSVARKHCLIFKTYATSTSTDQASTTDMFHEDLNPDKGITEEEIEKKRNKNRLPERVHRVNILKEYEIPELKCHFTSKELRKIYGRSGKGSGLNPGIMWPTRDELQDLIEHDRMFHPPLKDMLAKIAQDQVEEEKSRQEYEDEVDKNMIKHDKWVQDRYTKIAKKETAAAEMRKKRELLIEEISEYLGYEVDPKDPRFKEAVEQRDREKKKAMRKKKEEESYQKMLQRLSDMAKSSDS